MYSKSNSIQPNNFQCLETWVSSLIFSLIDVLDVLTSDFDAFSCKDP